MSGLENLPTLFTVGSRFPAKLEEVIPKPFPNDKATRFWHQAPASCLRSLNFVSILAPMLRLGEHAEGEREL